jgi:hypothetical protein
VLPFMGLTTHSLGLGGGVGAAGVLAGGAGGALLGGGAGGGVLLPGSGQPVLSARLQAAQALAT